MAWRVRDTQQMSEQPLLRLTPPTARYPLLDLLRCVAASMVMLLHLTVAIGGSERFSSLHSFPIVGFLILNGSYGVQIFFVISGYIICHSMQNRGGFEFLFKRAVRIFPGLTVSVLICILVGNHFITTYPNSLGSFFGGIILLEEELGVQRVVTQAWTLEWEIIFYCLIGLVIFGFNGRIASAKELSTPLTVYVLYLLGLQPIFPQWVNEILAVGGYGSLFALGLCLAVLSESLPRKQLKDGIWTRQTIREEFTSIIYPTILCICLYIESVAFNFNKISLLLLASCLVILISPRCSIPDTQYWLSNIIGTLGLASYLIYLLHVQCGEAFILLAKKHISPNDYIALTLGCVGVVFFRLE
jgi:peptidoglycan/LPS O-acetylase OafA/YrhL